VEVDGVDLSNHFSSIEVVSEKDERDVTGFKSAYKEIALGLGDGSFNGEVFQDYDAGSVDATLWPLHDTGETFPVTVTNEDGTVEYAMTAVLPSFNPLSGSVGEENQTSVTFRNASQDGIVRTELST
jgi:hypothetical protein